MLWSRDAGQEQRQRVVIERRMASHTSKARMSSALYIALVSAGPESGPSCGRRGQHRHECGRTIESRGLLVR